jgi:hypothetical protein
MPKPARSVLERDLIEAHKLGNSSRLAELYLTAARSEEADGRTEAACFFLTQAYVFALESGSQIASGIAARLRAYQREPAE